ncbi:hypothetical protein ACGG0V_004112 [Salmonella enterica]
MKENQIRELVNELRDIAIEYHGTQQLRERIARTVRAAWHHDLEKPNQPVSQTYNLPELIEGMEVSIDVSTCGADAGNRYFGTVTEVSELYTAKNGYILLVQYAEPNFDVNGNTPVQSPIDHGYRPECECSGCKATARICAELNNEEAEIFADGYNAAMQSFVITERLNQAPVKQPSNAEQVADLYALCWKPGDVVTYTLDPEKASIWLNNYSGTCVQEYVKLERFQGMESDNSPVAAPWRTRQ